jgi:hypothetical protein
VGKIKRNKKKVARKTTYRVRVGEEEEEERG